MHGLSSPFVSEQFLADWFVFSFVDACDCETILLCDLCLGSYSWTSIGLRRTGPNDSIDDRVAELKSLLRKSPDPRHRRACWAVGV